MSNQRKLPTMSREEIAAVHLAKAKIGLANTMAEQPAAPKPVERPAAIHCPGHKFRPTTFGIEACSVCDVVKSEWEIWTRAEVQPES